MSEQEMVSLECPHCQQELYQPLSWFKGGEFSCPLCGEVLTAEDFAKTIAALEEAIDAWEAEMINGEEEPASCCCGGKGHCPGGGCD